MLRIAAIVLLLLVPSAMAADVYLPGTVSGSSVPVVVNNLLGTDTVEVTVGSSTKTLPGSDTIRADMFDSVPRGLHAWTVKVSTVTSSTPPTTSTVTHRGFVHVAALDGSAASQARVQIPDSVAGSSVPVVVENLANTDAVRVYVGQLDQNLTATTAIRATTFEKLTHGLHPWRVVVTNVGGSHTFQGYVQVIGGQFGATTTGSTSTSTSTGTGSTSSSASSGGVTLAQLESGLASLETQIKAAVSASNVANQALHGPNSSIDHLRRDLESIQTDVDALQSAISTQESKQTLSFLDLRDRLDSTNLTVGGLQTQQNQVAKQADKASTTGIATTSLISLALLAVSAGVAFLWWSERQRHKESMALLLAAAVRMGINEDSDELKTALDILSK